MVFSIRNQYAGATRLRRARITWVILLIIVLPYRVFECVLSLKDTQLLKEQKLSNNCYIDATYSKDLATLRKKDHIQIFQ